MFGEGGEGKGGQKRWMEEEREGRKEEWREGGCQTCSVREIYGKKKTLCLLLAERKEGEREGRRKDRREEEVWGMDKREERETRDR